MNKIKLRKSTKDIKTLDKVKDFSKHMKCSYVKTKEKAEETQKTDTDNFHSYATQSLSDSIKEVSDSSAHKVERFSRKSLKNTPDTIRNIKAGTANIKQQVQNTIKNIKTKSAAKNASRASKNTGKMASNTVKFSKQAAQTTVKTSQATIKASQKVAQTSRSTVRATARTAKATAKAVVAAVKATVAAMKGLITLIAAGGWIAVVIILIICMAALLVSSPFGIFSANDKTEPDNMTLSVVIAQVNQEFNDKIDQIKSENFHNEVDGVTTPQNWKDVLAIYAVKYSTTNEVATVDNQKREAVKSVFWDMNDISFKIEESITSVETSSSKSISKIILHIIIKNNSCSEMAAQYAFNSEQIKLLDDLMDQKYEEMWNSLITIN